MPVVRANKMVEGTRQISSASFALVARCSSFAVRTTPLRARSAAQALLPGREAYVTAP
jgi:hypothetical protein